MNFNRDYIFAVLIHFDCGRRESLSFFIPGRPWSCQRTKAYLSIGSSEGNTDEDHQSHKDCSCQSASPLSSQGIFSQNVTVFFINFIINF